MAEGGKVTARSAREDVSELQRSYLCCCHLVTLSPIAKRVRSGYKAIYERLCLFPVVIIRTADALEPETEPSNLWCPSGVALVLFVGASAFVIIQASLSLKANSRSLYAPEWAIAWICSGVKRLPSSSM